MLDLHAQETPRLNGKQILVVDDNAVNLDIAAEALMHSGAVVESVSSGADALGFIDRVRYDLILLDLAMPGIDGNAVGRAVRVSAKNCDTPILVFTASDDADAQKAVTLLNAQGLVSKPVDIDDLLTTAISQVRG